MAMMARKILPSRCRRGERNLKQFFVPLIPHGHKILIPHRTRLLGPDPVRWAMKLP
jgi:hypothetical protein